MSTEDQLSIEDRVRRATRAGASLIGDVRPLPEPVPARLHRRRRPEPGPRRWLSWGIPLAAAAAVVAIALSLVAIRQSGTSSPSPSRPPVPAGSAAIPRYYAALARDAQGATGAGPLIVGDDLTGKVIDTIGAPHGLTFANVLGTSDDRTFVVMASRLTASGQVSTAPDLWYLLRIAPGSARPYRLTELPLELPAGSSDAVTVAMSPNGRELAVESQPGVSTTHDLFTLGIYSAATGAKVHAWTTHTNLRGGLGTSTLTWLANGRQLVFSVGAFTTGSSYTLQLRALDVAGSGTDLMTGSRALLTVPNSGPSTCDSLHITPNGETAVCATQYDFLSGGGSNAGCANGGLELTAYSIRTGEPVGVLYRYQGACHNGLSSLLWTDASARYIIGATVINEANEGGKLAGQLGVIANGHFRPLKIAKSAPAAYYGTVAF